MRTTEYLFVIAGYANDTERMASELNRRYADRNIRFLARDYPSRADKQASYVLELFRSVVNEVFGREGAANFCRDLERPCILSDGGDRRSKERFCANRGQLIACARARPKMLVALAAPWIAERVFEALPRSILIHQGPVAPPSADELATVVERLLPSLAVIRSFLLNLPLNKSAAKLPVRNFQHLNGTALARDVFQDPDRLTDHVEHWQGVLYDGSRQNPRKPIRGGYLLEGETILQRDRMHDAAQLGQQSREHVFHLLSAYHDFGVATVPGLHFDVFRLSASALDRSFCDQLTKAETDRNATHVNITPSDRAWE